jgi:hypothetical protein
MEMSKIHNSYHELLRTITAEWEAKIDEAENIGEYQRAREMYCEMRGKLAGAKEMYLLIADVVE